MPVRRSFGPTSLLFLQFCWIWGEWWNHMRCFECAPATESCWILFKSADVYGREWIWPDWSRRDRWHHRPLWHIISYIQPSQFRKMRCPGHNSPSVGTKVHQTTCPKQLQSNGIYSQWRFMAISEDLVTFLPRMKDRDVSGDRKIWAQSRQKHWNRVISGT